MEEMITNEQKQLNYKILKSKLKKAIDNEFWLEASMIEYAIIEDRCSSILDHARLCKDPYSPNKMLKNKLNSIDLALGKKHPALVKKIDRELIESIHAWREARNNIVHRSCIRVYDSSEIREIAETGKQLVDSLDNAAKRIKTQCLKLYGTEE